MSISLLLFGTPGLINQLNDGYRDAVLTDAPLYYYRMNTLTGTEPSIGTSNVALTYSASGIVRGVTGLLSSSNKPDLATSFSGNTGAKASFVSTLSGKVNVTAEMLVRVNSASSKGAFMKISDDNNSGIGIGVGSGNFDILGNNLIGLAETVAWFDTGIPLGTGINHLVVTINSSNTITLYLNGVQVGQFTPNWVGFANSNITIGGYSTRFANAVIDEVAIYNKILSTGSITTHNNAK